jgi:hypothetical protein
VSESRPNPTNSDQDNPPATEQPQSPTSQAPTSQSPSRPTDGSAELIESIRSRLAEHDVLAAQRRVELAAELARQEAILSERLRRQQLDAAAASFADIHDTYSQLAAVADATFDELYSISCRAAVAFKAAVQAEHARREFILTLETAWRGLSTVSEENTQITKPDIDSPRDFRFGPHDHRRGTALTGLLVYPEIKRQLAALADSGPRPEPERVAERAPRRRGVSDVRHIDQLDAIFDRSQLKRGHDDAVRQVSTG